MRLWILRRISLAALLVNVTHSIFPGRIPRSFTRYAKRLERALVFPLPAPATTRTNPSVVVTASFCALFRSFKMSNSSSNVYPPINKTLGTGPPVPDTKTIRESLHGLSTLIQNLLEISLNKSLSCDCSLERCLCQSIFGTAALG